MAWEIDAIHSHARFSFRQTTAKPIRGRFDAIRGYLFIDQENPMHSWVDAEVDAASIDTGSVERDARLRSGAVLDAAAYPSITFKSNRVEHVAGQDYTLSGELAMHGATQLVRFDAGFDEHGGVSEVRCPALTARASLNCADFGLASGTAGATRQPVPGEAGAVEIDLTLVSHLPAYPWLTAYPQQIESEHR
jgi:polyisoprenoid-binding protein YceI